MRAGYKGIYEAIALHKDGTNIPVELHGTSTHYKGRAVWVTAVRDITERKQAVEEMAKFVSLVQNSSDFISISSMEGQVLFVNAAGRQLVGLGPTEDVRSKTIADFNTPEGLAEVMEIIIPAVKATGHWAGESTVRHFVTKEAIPVRVNSFILKHPDNGEPIGLATVRRDITESKRAEAALRASEQQLSLIFDTVGDVIFLLSVEPEDCFRFIAMNPTGLAVTGLDREHVVGKRVEEVLPETAHALVIGKYKEAIRENKMVRWEEVSEYPTGTLYGEVAVTPAWDTAGNCTHLIGSVHDITGIRRAERALRESEERYRLVVRASNTGIWDWDLRSNDIYFSPIWKSQLGYADHELPNRFDVWESRLHPEDKERMLAAVQAYLTNPRQDYQQEFRLRHKDGSYCWILTQAILLLDADDKPYRMVGTHVDITERKRDEEALRRYAERLNVLHEIDQAILAARSAEEIAEAALGRVQ
jgi:PAS domain S-box-containing protein